MSAIRRAIDVVVVVTVLVLASPVLLVVAVAVRCTLGSPVTFRQQRLGLGGRPFTMVKFRTMRPAAHGAWDPTTDAERVSRLGSWLRSTSLDELPTLVNVLRGDMAIVGPRPLPVEYWHRFRDDEYRRFEVPPGVTGLAQVAGRNLVDWDERLALDVRYVETRSLRGDLRIVLDTIGLVLRRHGVEANNGTPMHVLPEDR